MGGNLSARHNLGNDEVRAGKWKRARHNLELLAGNLDRALKHHMIAIRSGQNNSLNVIKMLYSRGHAPKEIYTLALQSYQEYLGEIKSSQRDEAAVADEDNRYY